MNEYAVYMEWDSYEGSLFMETRTTWVCAFNEQEAIQKATSQFGSNKGFRIKWVDCEKKNV